MRYIEVVNYRETSPKACIMCKFYAWASLVGDDSHRCTLTGGPAWERHEDDGMYWHICDSFKWKDEE